MKRTLLKTADGSYTLEIPTSGETYHSRHGAKQESEHVFIRSGFDLLKEGVEILVLEVGFGTGLNALLTAEAAQSSQTVVRYHGIEPFPLSGKEAEMMNYADEDWKPFYSALHEATWGEWVSIKSEFMLYKSKSDLATTPLEPQTYDLVYFDAFGPRTQPEMWEKALFEKLFGAMKSGGVLVTYCAKGQVRRDLSASGFEVERLEGPPGKRHMLRGIKP